MKASKKFLALGLAASLLMGMGMTAFATEGTATPAVTEATETETTVATSGSVTLHNTLTAADGVVAPEITYTYAFGLTVAPGTLTQAQRASLSISSQTITVSNSAKTGSATVTLPTFPVAGEYRYTVTQSTTYEAGTGETLEDTDVTSYTLHVYVKNSANGPVVSAVTAWNGTAKVEEIDFSETFTKDASLTISKAVAGDYANKEQKFNYTVSFTLPETASEDDAVTVDTENSDVTATSAQGAYTFSLANGEEITFDAPAGTTYSITETQVAGYTGSVIVTSNGVAENEVSAEENENVTISNKTIGATAGAAAVNSAAFTNTFADIIITGVTTNNLPFVVMIVVAVAALAGFAVINKRRVR